MLGGGLVTTGVQAHPQTLYLVMPLNATRFTQISPKFDLNLPENDVFFEGGRKSKEILHHVNE